MAKEIYCVHCKRKTNTLNGHIVKSNHHKRLVGKCAICGDKKSSFIK